MFQEATQKIVKEIDPDGYTLIPASSSYYSDCYKPLHLIRIKKGFWIFTKDKYLTTSFTVADILKDGQDVDYGLEYSPFCCYSEHLRLAVTGSVDASVLNVGARASGSASSTISAVDMIKRTISEKRLFEVAKTRKIDSEHSFVKQLCNDTVYIISEVVETNKPCTLHSTSQADAGAKVPIKVITVEGELSKVEQKVFSFPAGTTIAYKVLELNITGDPTLDRNFKVQSKTRSLHSLSGVKAEIAILLAELTKLSKDIGLLFLNAILEILVRSDNIPVLETMLDQMCEGLQPELQVLDVMEDENRACVEKVLDPLGIQKADPSGQSLTLTPHQNGVIKAVSILIESLSALNPDTLILLATSVEMKIISTQLKLVERIEERIFPSYQYEAEQPRNEQETEERQETEETLALQLTDGEFEITQQMFEEFGFHLQRENASNSGIVDYGKKDMLLHVFAALYVLSALNN